MELDEITCADTDEGDLEARYTAGELNDDEAEAFEAHFFACVRCWTLVQRAVELRAVESGAVESAAVDTSAPSAPPSPDLREHRARGRSYAGATWGLALAAAAVIVVAGTLRFDDWLRPAPQAVAMRGPVDSLHVATRTRGMTLFADWFRYAEATSYKVRLYSASGTVLYQRELADTTIALAAGALPGLEPGAAVYWEIHALNLMRQVVARSGLRGVRFPSPVR